VGYVEGAWGMGAMWRAMWREHGEKEAQEQAQTEKEAQEQAQAEKEGDVVAGAKLKPRGWWQPSGALCLQRGLQQDLV